MKFLDKEKILGFMQLRKLSLYDQITRDFGGGRSGKVHEHMEVKYWKEAIERGEFDSEVPKVFVIYSENYPDIVDSVFYIDESVVKEKVEYLNFSAGREIFWYQPLSSSGEYDETCGKSGKLVEST